MAPPGGACSRIGRARIDGDRARIAGETCQQLMIEAGVPLDRRTADLARTERVRARGRTHELRAAVDRVTKGYGRPR